MKHRRSRTSICIASLAAAVGFCCGCSAWNGFGWWHCRSAAIPDRYPLGTVNRAHYHTMQTNAEAADLILHRREFVGDTAELSPYGKDHILEIAARARSVGFPVLVERSENNSESELDEQRRALVAQVLFDLGVPEAQQRTFVAPAYDRGRNSREAEIDYDRFLSTRGSGGTGALR